MELKHLFQVTIVLIISISNAHSKGSPWDWQSMNAKYPSENSRTGLPHRSSTNFPEILPVNANVSVFEGHTALLPCRIKHLKEYTVSWLRGDIAVLSVGLLTFISDQRFRVRRVDHEQDTSDWSLEISSANPKDEGWYDCQVNTEPKVNFKSYLRILPLPKSRNKQGKQASAALFPASASKDGSLQDAPADIRPQVIPQIQEFLQSFNSAKISIAGPPVLRKKAGSKVTLECTATNRVSSTPDLIWAHNGRVLPAPFSTSTAADDLDLRQKYQIETESKPGSKKGRLTVFDLHSEDAGTYACLNQEASNSRPATVRILVEPEGADILASRVAGRSGSSSIVHTTTLVTLLSVLQWF